MCDFHEFTRRPRASDTRRDPGRGEDAPDLFEEKRKRGTIHEREAASAGRGIALHPAFGQGKGGTAEFVEAQLDFLMANPPMLQVAFARSRRGLRRGNWVQNKPYIHLHLIMQTPQGGAVPRRATLEELPQNALIFDNGGEPEGNDRGLGKDRVENPIKSGKDFRRGLVRQGGAESGKKTTECSNIDPADRLAFHAVQRDIELALLLRNTVCK